MEMRILEVEIASFSNEKAEIEKLLQDYSLRHHQELGEIIQEILQLKKIALEKESAQNPEKQAAYNEAKQDYEDFHEQYEASKSQKLEALSKEEALKIKTMYREAALLCHPDKVHDSFKNQAQNVFVDLNHAYQQNNIAAVERILNNLKTGQRFATVSEKVDEKQQIWVVIMQLRQVLEQLKLEIAGLQEDETYRMVVALEDWDGHFGELKRKLGRQLEGLGWK